MFDRFSKSVHFRKKMADDILNGQTSEVPKQLTAKEILFIKHYCCCLDKKEAAIRCGYARNSAGETGYEIYKRPYVRKAIEDRLAEEFISEESNKKLIMNTAKANLADYYRPVQRIKHRREKVPLGHIIDTLERKIEFENEVHFYLALDPLQLACFEREQEGRRQEITRYQVELSQNPQATRIVELEPELYEEMELDINALIEDRDKVRIKSVKYTATGPHIELYNALEANTMLAKIYGTFEKDNKQKATITTLMNFDPLSEVEDSDLEAPEEEI